jgi:hypothetical protein
VREKYVVNDLVNEGEVEGLRLENPDLDGELELVAFKVSVGSGVILYDFVTEGERDVLLVIDGLAETLGDAHAVGVGLFTKVTRSTAPKPVFELSVTN